MKNVQDIIAELMDSLDPNKIDHKNIFFGALARTYCRPEMSAQIVDADFCIAATRQLQDELRNYLPHILEYVEKLQQKVDDHTADIMAALSEPCGLDDRVHCTCVPALRARIKDLENKCEVAQYAHMCRDGHELIGYNDSSQELCPVCILANELEAACQKK